MLIPYDFISLRQKVATGDNLEVLRAIATLVKHVDNLEIKVQELEKKLAESDKK